MWIAKMAVIDQSVPLSSQRVGWLSSFVLLRSARGGFLANFAPFQSLLLSVLQLVEGSFCSKVAAALSLRHMKTNCCRGLASRRQTCTFCHCACPYHATVLDSCQFSLLPIGTRCEQLHLRWEMLLLCVWDCAPLVPFVPLFSLSSRVSLLFSEERPLAKCQLLCVV